MIRLAGRPPFETLTPDEARQAYAASRKLLQPPPEDVAEIPRHHRRPARWPDRRAPLPARRHRSRRTSCRRWSGTTAAAGCWAISIRTTCPAAASPMPRAARWSRSITAWRRSTCSPPRSTIARRRHASIVFDNAAALGIDAGKVAVGGDSAGGNLAAVMALMARDGTLPPLAFQLLIYPATDMAMTTVSSTDHHPGVPLTSETMKWFIDHYCEGPTKPTGAPRRSARPASPAPRRRWC